MLRNKEHGQSERTNISLKDDCADRHVCGSGNSKVMSNLRFAVLMLTAVPLMRLLK